MHAARATGQWVTPSSTIDRGRGARGGNRVGGLRIGRRWKREGRESEGNGRARVSGGQIDRQAEREGASL